MEQHVTLVLIATLTTPAYALQTTQDRIAKVSINANSNSCFKQLQQLLNFVFLSVCVLPCPLGYDPNSACTECVPVHICVTNNPCQNGATCNIGTNSNTDYTCSCPPKQNCECKLYYFFCTKNYWTVELVGSIMVIIIITPPGGV